MATFAQKMRENRMVAVLFTPLGLIVAMLMLFSAVAGLILNEREVLLKAKTLAEGNKYVISVDGEHVDMINDGDLVHISGEITIDETLLDEQFKMEAYNVVKLHRVVEMYQWQEIESTDESGELEYFYERVWSENFIDSSGFVKAKKYKNIPMLLRGKVINAKNVNLGDFILPDNIVNEMTRYQELPMTELDFWKAEDNLQDLLQDRQSYFDEGSYFVGQNPAVPQIGDLRIRFEVILPETLSVIAKQNGNKLVSYSTKTGESIELFRYGTLSAGKMLREARLSLFFSKLTTRLLFFGLMFLGVYVIFNVLWIAKTSLVFFGNPTYSVGWLLSLIISIMLTFITIWLAWKDYNPTAGGILLVAALAPLYLLRYARKKPQLVPEKVVPQKV